MSANIPNDRLLSDLLKPTGFNCPEELQGKTFAESTSGEGGGLKYHLYAWDYAGGAAIAYSEKKVPVAGDVVFLKKDMEGGKITDPTQLKLVYHVVSDIDGKITVSEHPTGQAGGYVFNRNPDDDYEEIITDIQGATDIGSNGLLIAHRNTVLKGINVKVSGGPTKLYCFSTSVGIPNDRIYTTALPYDPSGAKYVVDGRIIPYAGGLPAPLVTRKAEDDITLV